MPRSYPPYFELFGEVADEKNDGETHVLATVSIQCDFERNMIEEASHPYVADDTCVRA